MSPLPAPVATPDEFARLRRELATLRKQVARLTVATPASPLTAPAAPKPATKALPLADYARLKARIREVVRRVLPPLATVAVISKGDDELIKHDHRRGWHFPRRDDGVYAGHHPADAAAAIDQLEHARRAGAEYLLIPATAMWWLEHYPGFKRHLDGRYLGTHRDESCAIFALGRAATGPPRVGASKLGRYAALVRQVQEVVRFTLPPKVTILVVSKGDEEMLRLGDRKAWHFPRAPSGGYAGYYPATGLDAVAHLEEACRAGADYFLLPHTAFWWLDHYAEIGAYLENRARLVVRQDHVCRIYALGDLTPSPPGRRQG